MKPFIRSTDRAPLAPVGWVAKPVGVWDGKEVEVVYDPDVHRVVLMRRNASEETRSHMTANGYRESATDGVSELWVRDEPSVMQKRLDRVAQRAVQRTSQQGLSRR